MDHTNPPPLFASERSGLKGLIVFALFWNVISFAVAGAVTLDLPKAFAQGKYGALAVYLFPLVGVLLIGWVVKAWLHDRRFGKTALLMDPYPGAIGGQVGGAIVIPVAMPSDAVYRICIQCLQSRETRDSKGRRSVSTSLEWQDEMSGRVEPGSGDVRVRFCFDIPSDLPEPTPKAKQWYHWKLSVSADVPGVDLDASYELPMEKSNKSCSAPIPGLERERQRTRSEQLLKILNADYQNDTLYFDFPYGRDKASALILLLAGAGFSAAGIAVMIAEASKGGLGVGIALFASVFILAGGAMLVGAAYIPFNKLQIAIDPEAVHIRRFWLGFSLLRKQLAICELTELKMERRSSVNNGKQFTVYYRIVVKDNQGKTWTIAESIPGRNLAEETLRFLSGQTALKCLRPSP